MSGALALCLAAWLVAGATGLPLDPFAPFVALVALRTEWPLGLRIAAATALGPIAAGLCGDVVLERTVFYVATAAVAAQAGNTLHDGVISRTGLLSATLITTLGVRWGLSLGGAVPPPSETPLGIALTILWTAGHATLCHLPDQARHRLGWT